MRVFRPWITVVLSVALLGGVVTASSNVIAPGGGGVAMDNSLTFGVDAGRSRTVNSSSYSVTYAYPSQDGTSGGTSTGAPLTVPVPGFAEALNGQVDSMSTPVVDGNMVYQYGYVPAGSSGSYNRNSSATGLLYSVNLSGAVPANGWGGDVWTLPASGQMGASTPCKSTPNMAGVSAPTMDPSSGYLAIAAGCYIYWTSLSNLQPSSATQAVTATASPWASQVIQGNSSAQAGNLVAESPIITQPLPVNYSGPLGPTPASTPFVCAGDWNQGMACAAMASFAGETPPAAVDWTIPTSCTTTDPGDSAPITWVGGCQALDNGGYAILTSSPSWDPQANVGGSSGAVVFGINNGTSGPGAVVELNPISGASRVIVLKAGFDGLTTNAAGVSSSVAVYEYGTGAPPDGTMIVPDSYGDLYELSPGGTLLASMTESSIANRICATCSAYPWDISDVAVGQYSVYAVERGLSQLWRFGASNLAPIGQYAAEGGSFRGAYSPTVVRVPGSTTDAYLYVNSQGSASTGYIYDIPIGSSAQASGGAAPFSTTTGSPPFVAALPDAGSSHMTLLWSNRNGGEFDYWVPVSYSGESVGLSINNGGSPATSITIQPGQTVTFDMYSSLPSLGQCDSNTTIAPNMTCLNLWVDGNGVSEIVASDENTLSPAPPYTITQTSSNGTGATWQSQAVQFNTPGTYALHAVLTNTASNWPGGSDPSAVPPSANVTVVVASPSPPSGTPPSPGQSPSCSTLSSTGWNTPANCVGGLPSSPPAPQVTGTLTMEVGDHGSNYSPVYDPSWSPSSGQPDPCIDYNPGTCTSPYMGYQPDQYAMFGQHLLVKVTPQQPVAAPPVLSSPPSSSYRPGVCSIYLPPSGQDYVTLPQGISEETGQPWTQEWDPLQSGGSTLSGQVLVDWAWWPPKPVGTIVGPQDLVSYWVANVSRWEYQRVAHAHYDPSTGQTTYTYTWNPSCTSVGQEEGETNPATNTAQGGQVAVWGDRIVLLTPTTEEYKWGLP